MLVDRKILEEGENVLVPTAPHWRRDLESKLPRLQPTGSRPVLISCGPLSTTSILLLIHLDASPYLPVHSPGLAALCSFLHVLHLLFYFHESTSYFHGHAAALLRTLPWNLFQHTSVYELLVRNRPNLRSSDRITRNLIRILSRLMLQDMKPNNLQVL